MDDSISLQLDDDGFLSQECPQCERRFKVKATQTREEGTGPIAYCPYCGHHGTGCWWTPEQAEYLGEVVIGPLREELERVARDFTRKNQLCFDVKRNTQGADPRRPTEPNEPMPLIVFYCHDEPVKHDGNSIELRCIICGSPQVVDQDDLPPA